MSASEVLTVWIAGHWRVGVPWQAARGIVRYMACHGRGWFPPDAQTQSIQSAGARFVGSMCAEQLIGGQSMVTHGLSNRIRSAPSIYDTVGVPIGTIPGGGVVTVVEAPVCADGYGWWKVNYEGTIG